MTDSVDAFAKQFEILQNLVVGVQNFFYVKTCIINVLVGAQLDDLSVL